LVEFSTGALAVNPDGRHVYQAGRRFSAYAALAVSPDGQNVYSAGATPWTSVFSRDLGTGALTYVETQDFAAPPNTVTVYRVLPSPCSPVPLGACRRPTLERRAVLQLKDDVLDSRDVLSWSWRKGAATDAGELGIGALSYTVCLYDQSGPGATPKLVMSSTAPPNGNCPHLTSGPCWKLTQSSRPALKYGDSLRTPDGLGRLNVKTGPEGTASIKVKGMGSNLGMPPLPLAAPVTMQLQSSSGLCWESVYDTSIVTNEAGFFLARGDPP
jgi:hypothetical protein